MTTKIYTSNQFHSDRYIGMWLDFEGIDYQLVADPDQADYCINAGADSDIILSVFHDSENQTLGIEKTPYITVTNAWNPDVPNAVFNDFLWNRTKAYYTKFDFSPHTRLWYWGGLDCYVQPTQTQDTVKTHIYLNPARQHHNRSEYRKTLAMFLQLKHSSMGLTSPLRTQTGKYTGQGYSPPHSAYYEQTCFSVYAETIESGHGIAVTEKTWDPLIKGHFILPYSNQGFVNRLKDLGVVFPDFINYDYDNIANGRQRYLAYQQELDRLCLISLKHWQELWFKYFDVIKHNQNLLYNKPIHKTGLVDQK